MPDNTGAEDVLLDLLLFFARVSGNCISVRSDITLVATLKRTAR